MWTDASSSSGFEFDDRLRSVVAFFGLPNDQALTDGDQL
jgi:hypothetical protein